MGNYKHWVVNVVASEKNDLQAIAAKAKAFDLMCTLSLKSKGDYFASIVDLNVKTSSRWEEEHSMRVTEFLEWLEEFDLDVTDSKRDGYLHWIAVVFGKIPSKIVGGD